MPRFDTLLDLVRILDQDMLLVPRALVPAVQSLMRAHNAPAESDERPSLCCGRRGISAEGKTPR